MDFDITQEGIFSRDRGQSAKVCERPVELVSYSQLDRTIYLRWPAEHRYYHMAALPQALLSDNDSELAGWAERNGVPVTEGMVEAFGDYLRQQAPALVG